MPCIRFDKKKTRWWSLASFDLSEKLDLVTEGRKIGLYPASLKLNFLLFSSAPCISSPSTFMSIPFFFFCQPLIFLLSIPLYFFCHPLVLLLPSHCISFAIPLYFFCYPFVFRLSIAMYFSKKKSASSAVSRPLCLWFN